MSVLTLTSEVRETKKGSDESGGTITGFPTRHRCWSLIGVGLHPVDDTPGFVTGDGPLVISSSRMSFVSNPRRDTPPTSNDLYSRIAGPGKNEGVGFPPVPLR